ncbi:MAG: hypothetical protein AB7S75_05545 [Desulfococcaceae bacterium]
MFDERTSEEDFRNKIDSWYNLKDKNGVAVELIELNKNSVNEFFTLLTQSVSRFIERVIIVPLHGQESVSVSITEAIDFLKKYSENKPKLPLAKYEIIIRYNTGDRIEASFRDKKNTIKFLETYI